MLSDMESDKISRHSRTASLIILAMLISIPASNASIIGGYFLPSGPNGDSYSYRWHYKEWSNYCPACHRSGGLALNPKGTYEGELTCMYCDADFDGVSGLEKRNPPRWRLIPASKSIGTKIRVDLQSLIRPDTVTGQWGMVTESPQLPLFYPE